MPKLYVTGEDGGELEFSVSDNPHDIDRIDVSNAPILITHLRVRNRSCPFCVFCFWMGVVAFNETDVVCGISYSSTS